MTDKVALPPPTEPLTLGAPSQSLGFGAGSSYAQQSKSGAKKVSEPWYRWFSKVNTALNAVGDGFDGILTGTCTLTMTFGGSSTGVTYSSHTGDYTRVGPLVFLTDCRITLTSNGTGVGINNVQGLPFTSNGFATGECQMVAGGSSALGLYFRTDNGTATGTFFIKGATNDAVPTDTELTNTFDAIFSITYLTSD